MRGFTLILQDAVRGERVEGVRSFVGEDASGSFGILPGHERFLTALGFGLARFRHADGSWEFLAVPGALLYFVADTLSLSTRRYLRDRDYDRISAALTEHLVVEEERLHRMKESLGRMEEQILRRLWELRRDARRVT